MKLNYLLLSILLLLNLTGCGDGGEEGSNTTPQSQTPEETLTTITGVFLDSPVSGLRYKCVNYSNSPLKYAYGITNTLGEFTCENSSTISFFITDETNRTILDLGYAKIATIITPLDLSEFLYAQDKEILNVLQLLQTLDRDKNATNGIDIDFAKTSKLRAKLQTSSLYFGEDNFDLKLEEALQENIVSPEQAFEHFNKNLREQNRPEIMMDHTSPIFTTPSSVTLDENIQEIMNIDATDNNNLVYAIEGYSPLFKIDSTSGMLSFISYGNYEEGQSYSLKVSAYDGVNSSYQIITVNLLDIDENSPVINAPNTVTVDENQLFAFDINASDESSLTYTLSGTDASYFDVNQSSGIVTFKTVSDYENGHSYYYYLRVDVNDSLANSSAQNIKLILNPVNDNSPVITVESIYNIYENTYSAKIPFSITDDDFSNDAFTLSLLGDDASFFSVSSSANVGSGNIYFTGALDYETQQHSYTFQLKIQDGNYTIIKDIIVNLLDVDENPPILTLPETLTVDENQVKILDINATDENNLTYSVLGRTPYTSNTDTIFSIDNNGTLSWKIDPDYETSNSWKTYYADITVSDGLNSVKKMITIYLRNLNDNAPVITSTSNITLAENELEVLRVTTTDADTDGTENVGIRFSIKDGDSTFFDISNTGILTFKTAPDYENDKHNYTLTLEASDANFSTSQTLNITVTDIDEDAPTFTTTDTNVTVEENQLSVMQVSATDENNITYSVQSGDYYKFDINGTSGVITFKNLTYADYESKSILTFQVKASDGRNTRTQDITVNLKNLNDNRPTISGSTTKSVYENSTVIALYTIEDADDDNISVTLNNALFDYNSSSKYLSFKSAPDYESDTHTYSVTLTASDALYSSSIDITINLLNRDDVIPILNNFTASLDENIPIGTVIGTVSVSNSGDSNITYYNLSGTNSNHFTIDVNGEITTSSNIDYESIDRYNLTVKASNKAGYSDDKSVTINVNDIAEKNIPTLVVIMNWNDYDAGTASEWYNKIFNKSSNSVAKWYQESTNGEIRFIPVNNSAATDNGIIIVDMGIDHPGGNNDTDFRDTHITNAITSSTVVDSIDFAALDTDGNGNLDVSEIQIIFIVAGGEESYGDAQSHSIWAHAWAYSSTSAPSVDGVTVMKYTGDDASSGSYSRFGASHGDHRASIGVIVHELGHAMLNLRDFYDNGGGSGLGWYDVMSGGAWAIQDSDTYDGDTPTQFSTYNKMLANLDMNRTTLSSSSTVTIKCSSNDDIKLTTSNSNEYFLIECRDTEKANSDISMNNARIGGYIHSDNDSFVNRLFTLIYHVDDSKSNNYENGTQTDSNHYNIAILEKDPTINSMTSEESINADYNDVYIQGDVIQSRRTNLYDGSSTGYRIEVTNENYSERTMTIQITK